MFIFVLRISNTAILNIFWYHSTIMCLIPLSCVSFSRIMCHTAIYASFRYLVSHSAILRLIPLSCISFRYLVSHSTILCLILLSCVSFEYLTSHSVTFYLIKLFCVSIYIILSHSVILCLIRLSCTSFSNIVSHSAVLSVPHWTLCDYYLITCANLTFRGKSGHVSNFFIASKGIFVKNL
jgi:hypothetical protein